MKTRPRPWRRRFAAPKTTASVETVAQTTPRIEVGAKEAGKMRLEGKDYIVKDGDVMTFRFNA